jgi:two-component system OmpR family sensor kinase
MTAMLIAVMLFLSFFISSYFNRSIEKRIISDAEKIVSIYPNGEDFLKEFNSFNLNRIFGVDISFEKRSQSISIKREQLNNHYYIKVTYPYPNSNKSLVLTKDITEEKSILENIYIIMLLVTLVGFIFIVYYSYKLSSQLVKPLNRLTYKFNNMNESILKPIETKELPTEFEKLANAFNTLINKIKTSINYRKELYVGTAHELKTPLAVMRLKNQITLMKYKRNDNIRETLQQNLESIDTLNNMIHNILEYGRAEGGQFEKPQRLNIIRLIAKKAEEYELLAHSKNRDFLYVFETERFMINIQPLLFMQIFQNFVQNALRFTPEGGLVKVWVHTDEKNFIVDIIDEGPGIDESENLFAPFKRSKDSTGAGLGLFLAQNAAESMGVILSLKNRTDGIRGAVASIIFPFERFLHPNNH